MFLIQSIISTCYLCTSKKRLMHNIWDTGSYDRLIVTLT